MTPPAFLQEWFSNLSFSNHSAALIFTVIAVAVVLLLSYGSLAISRRIARKVIPPLLQRTRNQWDDIFVKENVFTRLAMVVPVLVMQIFFPVVLANYPGAQTFAEKLTQILFIIVAVIVIDALFSALHGIYQTLKVSSEIPLTGSVQVLKILLFFISTVLVISVIFDRTPVYFFSGLGAMTAVLLLIFKDPILGFVAGVQLISNRMLKQGDWIEMPKYGADGDVLEITLTTVKVRNWDNTISTIPTYALITDSFKNWRGMQESGGRRIKRAICIDMNTIRFCTAQMLSRFAAMHPIAEYMQRKNEELAQHNAAQGIAADDAANARRLTNIGTFRAYVRAYLQNHPLINTNMTFLVRQLAPTEHGLPLEIYVFCKDKAWANYEAVQSDIFDHLLAIIPEFDLKVFQTPSGSDMHQLTERLPAAPPAAKA